MATLIRRPVGTIAGIVVFWLVFGILYMVAWFNGRGVDDDQEVASLTIGQVVKGLALIVLWPLEALESAAGENLNPFF